MEPQAIEELLEQANAQMLELSDTLAQLKRAVNTLQEDKNQLEIKIQDLQDVVRESTQVDADNPEGQEHTGGKERLQNFYDNGIHFCHQYFGMRRAPEEGCMFCQDILDRLD
ncbi:hypothetical protein CL176_00260 [Suicoccus acidiformans]|uniref:DNA replication initiation control protein YabA n=1 Tax=Suicoccus acidiformans TaxID=2036206 RepID=A0A347WHM6_9LACT|nr:initiation control protein YabA [Suicoccus acidiformans]AXY24583.1 hypothetical protein CL176_00260 [Suicoccus acidiformans]